MDRASVGEIVAIDRCDHDMLQAKILHYQPDVPRLLGI